MNLEAMIEAVLVSGAEDWMGIAELPFLARSIGGARGSDEELTICLKTVDELLKRGWATVGDVSSDGFQPWSTTSAEVLSRIETEWRALPMGPNLGDIGWLALTELGETKAADIRP